MAEVKTYKCDICGKIYHVDETHNESVTIVVKTVNENEGESNFYEHVCPSCKDNIDKVIANPKFIEGLADNLVACKKYQIDIKSCLDKIIRVFRNNDSLALGIPLYLTDISQYENEVSKCIEALVSIDTNRRIWKVISSILAGICITLCIIYFTRYFG